MKPHHQIPTPQNNFLSQAVHGTALLPLFQSPAAYTHEAFGVEYLYAQSGFIFDPKDEDLNEKIDDIEGIMDGEHELEMTNDY